jgi:malonyl-CoA decarboxylase
VHIKETLPHIKTLVTLSPIPGLILSLSYPGFRRWLTANYTTLIPELSQPHLSILSTLFPYESGTDQIPHFTTKIFDALVTNTNLHTLEPLLMHWCIQYLLVAKRKGSGAADIVLNFHVRNGAAFHGIHWGADDSSRGISQSFGIMANYLYLIEECERNSAFYVRKGIITRSGVGDF